MKKVSIYVVNKELKPANYYRIVQYADQIPNVTVHSITPTIWYDLSVRFRDHKQIKRIVREMAHVISMKRLKRFLEEDLERKPDYVIVQKSMSNRHIPEELKEMRKELLENSTLIWDFDDNIIIGQILQDEFDLYCEKAKHIIVTSEFLKNTLPEKCRDRVKFLPTTDCEMPIQPEELDSINQKRKDTMKEEINLIWLATSSNIEYLEPILPILDETAKEIEKMYQKKMILNVVCDKKIKGNYEALIIRNIKWTRKKAIDEVRKASIGIMPLPDTEYTKGKGGFKLIQYISTGLPVVASDVGYNGSIFKDDIGYLVQDQENKEVWKEAIINLVASEEKWESCSKKAYEVWNTYYHYQENIKYWKEILS